MQDDPYIRGNLVLEATVPCGNCHLEAVCIHIIGVTMPEGIKPNRSMIAYKLDGPSDTPPKALDHLGITCGCYARFHRQMTHIMDKRKK